MLGFSCVFVTGFATLFALITAFELKLELKTRIIFNPAKG